MDLVYYLILVGSTVMFATLAITGGYLLLTKLDLFDHPVERSNHANPVPTGAGLFMMIAILGFLTVGNAGGDLMIGTLLLMIVSFFDDMRSLPARQRLGFQAIAVIFAITSLSPIAGGLLPQWMEYIVFGGIWLWFINLYNFMDGIDEITCTETLTLCAGLMLLGWVVPEVPRHLSIDAAIIAAGVAAFYPWNKHPAKLFMGDSGSVPLGFLLGFLLLKLAASGAWGAALILPAYYLADATVTLLLRLRAGKNLFEAHSEHYYQQAVRGGRTHTQVTRQLRELNVILIALALFSTFNVWLSLICVAAAYGAAGYVMWRFRRPARIGHAAAA